MTHIDRLAAELRPTEGTRSLALAKAYDRFCQHHDRARFEAEKRAIRECRIIDMQEARRGR